MRKMFAAIIMGLSALAADSGASAQVSGATVEDATLQIMLSAGDWSEHADDDRHSEQLPFAAAMSLGSSAGANPRSASQLGDLGVLILALAVAEWGIKGPIAAQDPAKKNWAGPNMLGGKHLMSYTAGGVGIPHLDVEVAIPFFVRLGEAVPAASPEADELRHAGQHHGVFRYDVVRAQGGICSTMSPKPTLTADLDGEAFSAVAEHYAGSNYCSRFSGNARLDTQVWQRLRHWSRVGLRRRDMQAWVVQDWVTHQWLPAYNSVVGLPHGSLAEAFIIARIRNSSPALARSALAAAGEEPDPARRISAELRRYGRASETNRCRAGLMQRPSALLGLTVIPTDGKGCIPKSKVGNGSSVDSSFAATRERPSV